MTDADTDKVINHWQRGGILDAILAAMTEAGFDIDKLTAADLTPVDHLHGRGGEATEELLGRLNFEAAHRVLDIGSGIGGPARYVAGKYGCHVDGIDLTQEFCDVATELTRKVGLADLVECRQGDALALPFGDQSFDRAYTQNVSMNIADKATFFAEAFRVLKPGGLLAAAELAEGEAGPPLFPVPWADGPATSHLAGVDETRSLLENTGFEIVEFTDATGVMLEFGVRVRAKLEIEGPPLLGPHIVLGRGAKERLQNSGLSVEQGRTIPIEVICRRP